MVLCARAIRLIDSVKSIKLSNKVIQLNIIHYINMIKRSLYYIFKLLRYEILFDFNPWNDIDFFLKDLPLIAKSSPLLRPNNITTRITSKNKDSCAGGGFNPTKQRIF